MIKKDFGYQKLTKTKLPISPSSITRLNSESRETEKRLIQSCFTNISRGNAISKNWNTFWIPSTNVQEFYTGIFI